MSTKRQPSKQRRQTQNQKQRTALNARREAAAAATTTTPAGKVGASGAAASPRASVLSRLRGASTTGRAARTSRAVASAPAGTAASGAQTGGGGLPVGHRAALSALFAAIAGAAIGAFLFQVPVDRSGEAIASREALVSEWALSASDAVEANPDADPGEVADAVDDWLPGGSKPYVQAYWPISAAVVLPILGTGLGFRAVSRRSPAKLVNRTMYVTLFGALLSSQLLLVFLPAVISLAVAAFQVRKAEVKAQAVAAADPDVIDVDEADDVLDAPDGPEAADDTADLDGKGPVDVVDPEDVIEVDDDPERRR